MEFSIRRLSFKSQFPLYCGALGKLLNLSVFAFLICKMEHSSHPSPIYLIGYLLKSQIGSFSWSLLPCENTKKSLRRRRWPSPDHAGTPISILAYRTMRNKFLLWVPIPTPSTWQKNPSFSHIKAEKPSFHPEFSSRHSFLPFPY